MSLGGMNFENLRIHVISNSLTLSLSLLPGSGSRREHPVPATRCLLSTIMDPNPLDPQTQENSSVLFFGHDILSQK